MKKKSFKKAAQSFRKNTCGILSFVIKAEKYFGNEDKIRCYEFAIISLYREFEDLILTCLVALINSDSKTFSDQKSISFPTHMNIKVCEYLICGDGYFDFAGRSGLIKKIKQIVPDDHWFCRTLADSKYMESLNHLSALRNFAAHGSQVSKKKALEATGQRRMSSSGAYLKNNGRLQKICVDLQDISRKIEDNALY